MKNEPESDEWRGVYNKPPRIKRFQYVHDFVVLPDELWEDGIEMKSFTKLGTKNEGVVSS